MRTALTVVVSGTVILGMWDGLAPQSLRLHPGKAAVQSVATAAVAPPIWDVDLDGDGVPDLANPTHSFIRALDGWGSGAFGAERDGGKRKHEGADFVAAPGSAVRAPLSGVVTKEGFAYGRDTYLRFVELTDAPLHMMTRVFYVDPSITIGQTVRAGDIIGFAQTLEFRYPDITNHVHVEISGRRGAMIDPTKILPPAEIAPLFAALKQDAPQLTLIPTHG